MAKLRLTSKGIVDVDYSGIRLTSGGMVVGSPIVTAINPIAVDDVYNVTAGQLLTVDVLNGILANDTYNCIQSFNSAFSSAFNGGS